MKNICIRLSVATICMIFVSINFFAQKPDPAAIVAQHRTSIGAPTALEAIANQLILSDAQFTFRGSTSLIAGKFIIASTSDKSIFGMEFASNDYPQDRFGYDGKNVRVARSTPNARSLIGDFLNNNRTILRDGLLGGILSARWPLLDDKLRGGKLKDQGTKVIDGRQTVVISYEPKGGSELDIKLFFDVSTSRHLRTEYLLLRAASQGSNIDNSAGQSGTVYRLVEEFSNFAKMGDLQLPSVYKLTFSRSSAASLATAQTGNRDAEWTFKVTGYAVNRELDAGTFEISQN